MYVYVDNMMPTGMTVVDVTTARKNLSNLVSMVQDYEVVTIRNHYYCASLTCGHYRLVDGSWSR